GDERAAVPRPGHGERTQSENLWQTPGPKAHRSRRTCPRVGSVVASTSVCPHTCSQELPASNPSSQNFRTATLSLPPQNNTSNNTFVSIRDYRNAAILLVD